MKSNENFPKMYIYLQKLQNFSNSPSKYYFRKYKISKQKKKIDFLWEGI